MIDDELSHDGGADPSGSDRPETAGAGGRGGLALAVLALLMAGTCWVVASMASPWLVPPYLLLMALILSPTPGRRPDAPGGAGSESTTAFGSARPAEGPRDDTEPTPSDPATAGSPGPGTASTTATAPPKARRGKGGRSRKAKPAPEAPAEATWIEVGPGKFVRAEAPTPSAEAGPHAFEAGGPAEAPASPPVPEPDVAGTTTPPRPSEPEEPPTGDFSDPPAEARPWSNGPVVLSPEEEPIAAPALSDEFADPETSSDAGLGPEPDLALFDDGPPAADGIMPQAEGPFAGTEPDRPGALPGADNDRRASFDPRPGGSPADPESPEDEPARPEVPPETADEPREARFESDPTETAVDETVLDDAGPDPEPLEAIDPDDSPVAGLADRADPDEGAPSEGPSWWPRRLAAARPPRAPRGRRAIGHGSPPRRPARSDGPARRPPDPRRLTRRGAGRSRQATRTFPPRSPPGRGPADGG